ncbi:MAG TPA: hypothetical protein VKB76_08660, partial [Ktedonobacterales bacterium]|nr:hypothetical protein [Ktedonobacterales bacterium]
MPALFRPAWPKVIPMLFSLFVLFLAACENTTGTPLSSATDIINHAKSASLADATFSIMNNIPTDSPTPTPGANALPFTYSGTGVYTAHPLRLDIKLAVNFLGVQADIEEIID